MSILAEACSLHPLTLASGLIRRRQCNVSFFLSPPPNGMADSYLKWMKALGKRKSNREGTFLPVLSGGMSRAAINKCVSSEWAREKDRDKEGERERKKQQCGTWHLLVRLCRRRPRGIRLNEEKTFKCAEASFVDVERRLVSLCLCRISLTKRGINRWLLIKSRERWGKQTQIRYEHVLIFLYSKHFWNIIAIVLLHLKYYIHIYIYINNWRFLTKSNKSTFFF